MEKDNNWIWEVSAWEFVFVTIILAGAGAYLTGRASARSWENSLQLVLYVIFLTAATRFIHFALFEGTLLSPYYFLVDFIVLLAFAFLGRQRTRAGQMSTQYAFEYTRKGALGWGRNASADRTGAGPQH